MKDWHDIIEQVCGNFTCQRDSNHDIVLVHCTSLANHNDYEGNCNIENCPLINHDKEKPDKVLGDCLGEAKEVITGERQDQYGNPEDSFALIAEYWSTYLDCVGYQGPKILAKDIAHMMMLFKIARCTGQESKRDNYVDIAGYASIVADRLI